MIHHILKKTVAAAEESCKGSDDKCKRHLEIDALHGRAHSAYQTATVVEGCETVAVVTLILIVKHNSYFFEE